MLLDSIEEGVRVGLAGNFESSESFAYRFSDSEKKGL
jgi:hypothetical protein